MYQRQRQRGRGAKDCTRGRDGGIDKTNNINTTTTTTNNNNSILSRPVNTLYMLRLYQRQRWRR